MGVKDFVLGISCLQAIVNCYYSEPSENPIRALIRGPIIGAEVIGLVLREGIQF